MLVALFCLFALSMLAAPVRRGDIPHPAPCHPGEVVGPDNLCYCNPVMDCTVDH